MRPGCEPVQSQFAEFFLVITLLANVILAIAHPVASFQFAAGYAFLKLAANNATSAVTMRHHLTFAGRRFADLLLFGVTATEFVLLFILTPTFTVADGIYVLQHLIVLGIALTRPAPTVRDYSIASSIAVGVAYLYPYAQVIWLRWSSGDVAWPAAGLVLVILAAGLSLVSLLTIGRLFGVRPALRGLVTRGPYKFVRHPIYLSYVIADIGYNLQEWNLGTILLVLVGWASLVYRIKAEERVLSQHSGWADYASSVRSRVFPGLW